MLAQPSLASASVPPERSRSSGAVAALLVVGLLAGLAAGYAIWGRSGTTPATVAESSAAPAQTAATGKEFSEQAVTPRQTPAPTAQTGTGASPQSTGSSGSATAPLADAPPPPSKPAPVRAPTGRVVVRSTPAGAGVTINGDWRGRTPLTLTDLPLASYNVRVVQPGFIPATSTVALTAGEPSRTVAFRLRLQPGANAAAQRREPARAESAASSSFTGSIYVDSRPRGAQVSIDGKPVGVTPLRIPDVRIGTRIVRLELPDHRIWSSTARVTAGQESRVTGSLERIQ